MEFIEQVVQFNVRPPRPHNNNVSVTNELWSLAEECWSTDPSRRPAAEQVCDAMEIYSNAFLAHHPQQSTPAVSSLGIQTMSGVSSTYEAISSQAAYRDTSVVGLSRAREPVRRRTLQTPLLQDAFVTRPSTSPHTRRAQTVDTASLSPSLPGNDVWSNPHSRTLASSHGRLIGLTREGESTSIANSSSPFTPLLSSDMSTHSEFSSDDDCISKFEADDASILGLINTQAPRIESDCGHSDAYDHGIFAHQHHSPRHRSPERKFSWRVATKRWTLDELCHRWISSNDEEFQEIFLPTYPAFSDCMQVFQGVLDIAENNSEHPQVRHHRYVTLSSHLHMLNSTPASSRQYCIGSRGLSHLLSQKCWRRSNSSQAR